MSIKSSIFKALRDLKINKGSCIFLYIHAKLVRNWCGSNIRGRSSNTEKYMEEKYVLEDKIIIPKDYLEMTEEELQKKIDEQLAKDGKK